MPISREEFDQGRIDLAVPIMDLMAGRPAEAFTAPEVLDFLRDVAGRRATLGEIAFALEFLVTRRWALGKVVGGDRRYTIGEEGQFSSPGHRVNATNQAPV